MSKPAGPTWRAMSRWTHSLQLATWAPRPTVRDLLIRAMFELVGAIDQAGDVESPAVMESAVYRADAAAGYLVSARRMLDDPGQRVEQRRLPKPSDHWALALWLVVAADRCLGNPTQAAVFIRAAEAALREEWKQRD